MDRSLPACRTFCSRFMRMVMVNTVDKLAEALLIFGADIGPDDPRRDTIHQHKDHAKKQIPKYQCYPDDAPNRGHGPKPDDSGKGQGHNKPRPILKDSRSSTKDKGDGKKTSEIKRKCPNSVKGSAQAQVGRWLFLPRLGCPLAFPSRGSSR